MIVSWRSFPPKFPVKSADFSKNLPLKILWKLTFFPLKSREIGRLFPKFWLFPRENPAKSVNFSANLPPKIPRNLAFFSAKYQKPCLGEWQHAPSNKVNVSPVWILWKWIHTLHWICYWFLTLAPGMFFWYPLIAIYMQANVDGVKRQGHLLM